MITIFTDDQVKGSLSTVDRQLLYDIREELRELNKILTSAKKEPVQLEVLTDNRRGPRAKKGVV